MSRQYTFQHEPGVTFSFNQQDMLFDAEMNFLCEFVTGPTDTADPSQKSFVSPQEDQPTGAYMGTAWTNSYIPATIQLEYFGSPRFTDADLETVDQTTKCYLYEREVIDTDNDAAVMVRCRYAGRVQGTHQVSPRTQMSTVRQPHSLNLTGGDRIGIGPDFEGVARHMPITTMSVTEVVPDEDAALKHDAARVLAGSVNETGWSAPWNGVYDAGRWVYMGIAASAHDRRTHTVEIQHEFARRGDRLDQHFHYWFGYRDIRDPSGGEQTVRRYDSERSAAQFLPVAGSDDWWGSGATVTNWQSTFNFRPVWD